MNFGTTVKAPCKDCVNRKSGCHSKCEAYQSFRAKVNNEHMVRNAIAKENRDVFMSMHKMTRARILDGF